MNQYVNHTASDDVQSDIRAISALQAQSDDLSSRILEVETDTHAAHTKINGVINACDNYIEDVKNALLTVEKTAEKIDTRLSSLEGSMVSMAKAHSDTEKVMSEFKLFMGYTPSKDH